MKGVAMKLLTFAARLAILLPAAVCVGQSSRDGLLAVVNQKEHSVLLVDPAGGKVLNSVEVGINGHEIAASPAGDRLYVPIYGNAGVGRPGTDGRTIDVIDVRGWKLANTIDLGRPLRPHKPLFGPGGMLYVTGELAHAIEIVDVQKNSVAGEIPTGAKESHILAISPDGARGYTANVGDGSVSVLDIAGRKLIKVIPLTRRVQRMAVSNDGRWAFTSDWDQARVAVIDTRTNALSQWLATAAMPYVTQPTPDGKFLLVAETQGDKGLLEMFDLATWKVVRSYLLPCAQNGGFLVHGGLVYLSEPLGGRIEVLDLAGGEMREPIMLTLGVDGMAWLPAR